MDSLKGRFLWSRHAMRQAVEDSLKPNEVENALSTCLVMESGMGKEKAVCKLKGVYCTVIFAKMKLGIKIITCWRSSAWEIRVYDSEVKK
ncbi:DUF4258 domain-containing protein [Candidatus Micrarchaeota archaeon]|nr:DUF4258 domain-containing protein [Candidatus Micrarchaeota archaeon]MBU1939518.1 DUF4258 domain-containing protein [Candidatus Micrarchaeota archaeon]